MQGLSVTWLTLALNFWTKVVSDGSNKLGDSFDVIVLGADETEGALPRVLPQASHSQKRFGNWLEKLGVALAPVIVQLRHIDFSVEVLVDEKTLESIEVIGLWFYAHLDLLIRQSLELNEVL